MSKGKKGSSKKKYFIGIVVVCIIVLGAAAGFYFLRDNTNNKKNPDEDKVISLSNDETSEIAMFYDSRNQKDVMYNPIIVEGMITYSMDYDCEKPEEDMVFRDYLSDQGMAVLMNGYSHKSAKDMGVANDDEAYIATQMALWEVVNRTGESDKALSVFRVDQIEALADTDSYERVKAAAEKLVKLAEDDPYTIVPTMNVDNSNVELQNFGETEGLIGPYHINIDNVDDSSIKSIKVSLINEPESARITDKNGNRKTMIQNGDTIYVRLDQSEASKEFEIQIEACADRFTGVIYEEKGKSTQDYVRLETAPTFWKEHMTLEWEQVSTLGKIELTCVDEDGDVVTGAEFELLDYEENSILKAESGTDGIIKFYKVPVGEYILRQNTAPDGYRIKTKSKELTVKPSKTTKIKFVNSKE